MDNKTFKKMLLGMAMASPLALINSGNVHASSVKTNVETNWHANSLATVQQELRNQNINPDYKITNAKYIVQAGDTLSQIAAATHINMYHIAAVNHIQNLNLIYVGQVLILNQGNEVAHNVAGNGSTTAASIGNTYTLRSTSQQPVLNYYGHTQAQGTTGTPNVQRTANVNSQGVPAAAKPAKTVIPSTPSANNNNQNTKPTTPTGNTGVNTGSHAGNTAGSTVTGNTGVNTGSHAGNTTPSVSGSVNTGSTVTSNTQGSASQTGSSATQNNNSQKTPTVDSSSASQQAPAQSSSAQQPASSASHATAPSTSSNTQQPASSVSSASQPTGSSQAQGSVNTGSTVTSSDSQKTPTIDSSSASQSTTASSASSNTQQPAQSSSAQSGVSSSSQQTTTSSSSSQQPASSSQSTASTNSSSQSSASSNTQQPAQSSSSQSSASSSSQSSASSPSQSSTSSSASSSSQKTVDGYTLDNMPLSVFNDKKNLNAINNTFSGDAIENYFNNHIGKGNMTWDEAQQAQQNGQVTSAILAWNGQMLPTQIKGNTYGQAIQNSTTNVNWNNSLPLSYLRNDSQEAQINNKYGNISNETNESQSEGLTQYMLEVINNYRKSQGLSEATTDSALQQKAQERLNTLTSFSHSGMVTDDEALEEMEVTPNNEFDLMNQGYQSIVDMLLDDADSNWGHRNTLLHDKQFACAYKVVNGQGIIVIVANK